MGEIPQLDKEHLKSPVANTRLGMLYLKYLEQGKDMCFHPESSKHCNKTRKRNKGHSLKMKK